MLGLVETVVVGLGGSTYRDAMAFAILILILLLRPDGLLGQDAGGEGLMLLAVAATPLLAALAVIGAVSLRSPAATTPTSSISR